MFRFTSLISLFYFCSALAAPPSVEELERLEQQAYSSPAEVLRQLNTMSPNEWPEKLQLLFLGIKLNVLNLQGDYQQVLDLLENQDWQLEGDEELQGLLYDLRLEAGWAAEHLDQLEQAQNQYLAAQTIATRIRDREKTASAKLQLSAIAEARGNINQALTLAQQAYREVKDLLSPDIKNNAHNQLGNLYESLGDYRQAEAYHLKVLAKSTQEEDGYGRAVEHFNIASVNLNWAKELGQPEKREKIDKAEYHLQMAMTESGKRGFDVIKLNASSALIEILLEKGELEKARHLLPQGEMLLKQALSPYRKVGYLLAKTRYLMVMKEYDNATQALTQAIEMLKGARGYKNKYHIRIAAVASRLYEAKGDYKMALYWQRQLHKAESIRNKVRSNNELNELKIKFDSEQLGLQNRLLEKETQLQYSVIVLSGLLAFLLFVLLLYQIQKKRHLYQLAHRDPLTSLFNRRYLMSLGKRMLAKSKKHDMPMSVLLFDIDHFKQINDTYGHDAGDIVLQTLTSTLSLQLRDKDVFGRIGGEEFLLFLPMTRRLESIQIADRLRKAIEDFPILVNQIQEIRVTASFGIASSTKHDELKGLLDKADQALYKAKAAGRNRVLHFEET